MIMLSGALKFLFSLLLTLIAALVLLYMLFLTIVMVWEIITEIREWFRGDTWDK